jgi:hypothetical protein
MPNRRHDDDFERDRERIGSRFSHDRYASSHGYLTDDEQRSFRLGDRDRDGRLRVPAPGEGRALMDRMREETRGSRDEHRGGRDERRDSRSDYDDRERDVPHHHDYEDRRFGRGGDERGFAREDRERRVLRDDDERELRPEDRDWRGAWGGRDRWRDPVGGDLERRIARDEDRRYERDDQRWLARDERRPLDDRPHRGGQRPMVRGDEDRRPVDRRWRERDDERWAGPDDWRSRDEIADRDERLAGPDPRRWIEHDRERSFDRRDDRYREPDRVERHARGRGDDRSPGGGDRFGGGGDRVAGRGRRYH